MVNNLYSEELICVFPWTMNDLADTQGKDTQHPQTRFHQYISTDYTKEYSPRMLKPFIFPEKLVKFRSKLIPPKKQYHSQLWYLETQNNNNSLQQEQP